jgi:hypothetical protein
MAEWSHYLSEWAAFATFKTRFLQSTGIDATSLLCTTVCGAEVGCGRVIVVHSEDDIVAVCPERFSPAIPITDDARKIYRLKWSVIFKDLCTALKIDCRESPVRGCHQTWRIGDYTSAGKTYPIYFIHPADAGALELIVRNLALIYTEPFVLVTTSLSFRTAEVDELLSTRRSMLLALSEITRIHETGRLELTQSIETLLAPLVPQPIRPVDQSLPQNIFRQRGARWEVRFNGGETFWLNRQKGVEYLTRLLQAPHKQFSALELIHNGISDAPTEASLKASGINNSDATVINQLRQRQKDLREEIEEALEFNDEARAESLELEADKVESLLKSLVRPGGKITKSSDPMKKPREAVRIALERAFQAMREQGLQSLAAHLDQFIDRKGVVIYRPSTPIIWETTALTDLPE